MRLGAYPCVIEKGTHAHQAYGEKEISERHRHRYEFNNAYLKELKGAGLIISGVCPQGNLVEMVELADHPYFLGCQFHPEFKSKPFEAHPLFAKFIAESAAAAKRVSWVEEKGRKKGFRAETISAEIVKAEKKA